MLDINEIISDKKFVKYVINKYIPIHKMYELLEKQWSYDHNVYCAFHENHDTPSARMYKDSNRLYCYSEQRMYSPSDFIEKELINTRLESLFYRVWKQLDENTQQNLLDNFNINTDYKSKEFMEKASELEKFKNGEIDISTFRLILLKII